MKEGAIDVGGCRLDAFDLIAFEFISGWEIIN